MAKSGVCHSPIKSHLWSRPSGARSNAGENHKKGTVSNSPVCAFYWKRKGRQNA